MSITRASILEWKVTARLFGPWLPGCCLLATIATWIQEPLFLRDYGVQLLWDGGTTMLQLALPFVAFVWCANRSQAAAWQRLGRSNPFLTVLSGAIGLLFYGACLLALTLIVNLSLEATYRTHHDVVAVPRWLLAWLLPALPLCSLAPGLACTMKRPAATLLTLLAGAAACLGFTVPRYDNPIPLAMVGASAAAATGSMLLSVWLVRVAR